MKVIPGTAGQAIVDGLFSAVRDSPIYLQDHFLAISTRMENQANRYLYRRKTQHFTILTL